MEAPIDSWDADKVYCAYGWDSEIPCANERGWTRLHACVRDYPHDGRHQCDCGKGRAGLAEDFTLSE